MGIYNGTRIALRHNNRKDENMRYCIVPLFAHAHILRTLNLLLANALTVKVSHSTICTGCHFCAYVRSLDLHKKRYLVFPSIVR